MRKAIFALFFAAFVSILGNPLASGAVPESPQSSFEKGYAAYKQGDYKVALAEFLKAAEGGHLNACFNLGMMHQNGWGVNPDNKKALEWYRKAAEKGHPGAQVNLGVMFEKGRGVPRDYRRR